MYVASVPTAPLSSVTFACAGTANVAAGVDDDDAGTAVPAAIARSTSSRSTKPPGPVPATREISMPWCSAVSCALYDALPFSLPFFGAGATAGAAVGLAAAAAAG